MKRLKELVDLVSPNKTKTVTVIGNGKGGKTKLHQLYRLIARNEVVDDEEAFRVLYPGAKSKGSYYKLKHELREKLFSTLFFLDARKLTRDDRLSAYVRCQWLLALSSILMVTKAWSNALSTTKAALDISEKYEFTNEAISASRKLMIFNKIRGSKKEVTEGSLKLIPLVLLQQKETLAEVYWTQLSMAYLKASSYKESVVHRANNYLFQLRSIEVSQKSLKLIYHETMIEATVKMAGHNFQEAVPILTAGLGKISDYKKFIDKTYTYGIAVNLLACYISLKRHDEARNVLTILYSNVLTGTYNWYKTSELHFTLLMHTRNYDQAEALLQNVINQKTYPKQPDFIREAWAVYGAYLHILRQAGRLQKSTNKEARPFRIRRYLNELPTFARDKRGHNVTVLISQIILMLQRQNFDGLIDRFEAVNKYRERYVSREENFRSNVFLHMLREVNRKSFDREAILEATADLRLRLDEEPVDVISPGYDQEVLPYEEVWELLVESLN